jgi:hypothetical protein
MTAGRLKPILFFSRDRSGEPVHHSKASEKVVKRVGWVVLGQVVQNVDEIKF